MQKEAIRFERAPAPTFGELVFEREFPSEPDLIPAMVLRLVEFLRGEELIGEEGKSPLKLCFDEAMKNAALHGNRREASRRVSVAVYREPDDCWVVISDEGEGFELEGVPDPVGDFGLWRESGRGIHLMQHYTKALEFWGGGSTVALCFDRHTPARRVPARGI